MIEKKTLWHVSGNLEMQPKTAIVESGRVLAYKDADGEMYYGTSSSSFFATEDEARKYIEEQEQNIRDMVPRVMEFVNRMDYRQNLLKRLGIKMSDYLGGYAIKDNSGYEYYHQECCYTAKLETFIHSRLLNVDGYMIPFEQIKRVKWYGVENADNEESGDWKAEISMADGKTYKTNSAEDVRLLWTVFGKNGGAYFIDANINYNNDEKL